MSDNVVQFNVAGIPVVDGKKIIRLQDRKDFLNVTGTYGLDVIRSMLVNKSNLVVIEGHAAGLPCRCCCQLQGALEDLPARPAAALGTRGDGPGHR